MKEKEIIQIINRAVVDTNYVKDDKIACYNIKNVLKKWIIIYSFSNLVLYFIHTTGTLFNFTEKYWFYPLIRILYILLFIFTLISYLYFVNHSAISIKENDFLKLYTIVPMLLVFTKVIFPISYYLSSDMLIGLINTISLDQITLIISSFLLEFYFKDKHLNIFIVYNIVIYVLIIVLNFVFSSLDNSSSFIIDLYNLTNFLQDFGFFAIAHFILILIYMKKIIKNEKIYI